MRRAHDQHCVAVEIDLAQHRAHEVVGPLQRPPEHLRPLGRRRDVAVEVLAHEVGCFDERDRSGRPGLGERGRDRVDVEAQPVRRTGILAEQAVAEYARGHSAGGAHEAGDRGTPVEVRGRRVAVVAVGVGDDGRGVTGGGERIAEAADLRVVELGFVAALDRADAEVDETAVDVAPGTSGEELGAGGVAHVLARAERLAVERRACADGAGAGTEGRVAVGEVEGAADRARRQARDRGAVEQPVEVREAVRVHVLPADDGDREDQDPFGARRVTATARCRTRGRCEGTEQARGHDHQRGSGREADPENRSSSLRERPTGADATRHASTSALSGSSSSTAIGTSRFRLTHAPVRRRPAR